MRWAVIGSLKSATKDTPDALVCIKEGFLSEADALAFITEYRTTPETKQIARDLLPESYERDRWQFKGGRCFMNARLTLLRQYGDLQEEFACAFGPVVAIGERDLKDETGAIVRGKHGWIEVDDNVIDCGGFLVNPKCYAKEAYYKVWKVGVERYETYDEVKAGVDKALL